MSPLAVFAAELYTLVVLLVKFIDSQEVLVLKYLLNFGCVSVITEHDEHLLPPSQEHLGALAYLFVQLVVAHTINCLVKQGKRPRPVLCIHVVAHVHQRLTCVNLHMFGVLFYRFYLLVIDPVLEVIRDLFILVGHSVELYLIQLLAFLKHEFLEFFGERSRTTDVIRQNSAPELFDSLLEYLEVFVHLTLHVIDHNLVINDAIFLEDGIHQY